ncbi:DotD/TraH family lipoprotein [Yersinia ruckeri]
MKLSYLATLGLFLLSGCQARQAHPPSPSLQPASANSAQLQAIQQELYLKGALNQKAPHIPASITANSQRFSVDWEGDAIELLAQLARQRGLNFAYSGVRLPLPVSVHVDNITFENLLRQLETQIGWRASLKQQSLELHLYFALPDKGGRLA